MCLHEQGDAHIAAVKFAKQRMSPCCKISQGLVCVERCRLVSSVIFFSIIKLKLIYCKHWYILTCVREHKRVLQTHTNMCHPCNLKYLAGQTATCKTTHSAKHCCHLMSFCLQTVFCVRSRIWLFFCRFLDAAVCFLAFQFRKNTLFVLALRSRRHCKSQSTQPHLLITPRRLHAYTHFRS